MAIQKTQALIVIVIVIGCVLWRFKQLSLEPKTPNILAWGYNFSGQLGNGHQGKPEQETKYYQLPVPGVKQVAAGLNHTLALDEEGQVWAWGKNDVGQLGVGRETDATTSAMAVIFAQKVTIKQIAASQNHSLALDDHGHVWAWGLNLSGQLGLGNHEDQAKPMQISGLERIVQVAAGYRFSVALAEDKTVWAWGGLCPEDKIPGPDYVIKTDYYDPLDAEIDEDNEQNNCIGQNNVNIKSLTPKPIAGLDSIKAVAGGFGQILALKEDGTVWGWGCNKYGQLGRGFVGNPEEVRVAQVVKGLKNIVQIATGFRHSLAVDQDGHVWAWGHNSFGETVDKEATVSATPVVVPGIDQVVQVSGGYDYSLAVKSDGTVWGWGQNNYAQISLPAGGKLAPSQVWDLTNIESVVAGGGHVLAITK